MLVSVTWDSQLWPYGFENYGHDAVDFKATFTPYWMAFVQARKPYRIGILLTQKNGDFSPFSVTEISWAVPISKVWRHIPDRCSYYYGSLFLSIPRNSVNSFNLWSYAANLPAT